MGEKSQQELTDKEHVFLSWEAPAHFFKKPEKEDFLKLGFVTLFLLVILLFLKDFWLIALTLAFTFTISVLKIFPPKLVENKILNRGLFLDGHLYPWCELIGFWFVREEGGETLHLKTKRGFREEFSVPLDQAKTEEIKKALCLFLPFFENPPRSPLGRVEEYFVRKLL
jgi:hypothetical protein